MNSVFTKIKSSLPLQKSPFVYVAMGDSTAEGMGASTPERSYTKILYAHIKAQKTNAKYYNLGRSGSILRDVVNRQLPKAIDLNPSLITLSVGANDIIRRTKQQEFEKELKQLVEELHSKTQAILVISTVPDLSMTPAIPKFLQAYSKFMAGKLNKGIHSLTPNERLLVVDVFNDSKETLKAFPEALGSDGFHPSDFGYALWANTLITRISPILNPLVNDEKS